MMGLADLDPPYKSQNPTPAARMLPEDDVKEDGHAQSLAQIDFRGHLCWKLDQFGRVCGSGVNGDVSSAGAARDVVGHVAMVGIRSSCASHSRTADDAGPDGWDRAGSGVETSDCLHAFEVFRCVVRCEGIERCEHTSANASGRTEDR